MGRVDFAGGGSGQDREEAGQITREYQYWLDDTANRRILECYGLLEGKDMRGIGVATRRYLLARTERVRPADQIIDYAIALESMTSEWYADKQGRELAKRISVNLAERPIAEAEHERFRAAREKIVHDGQVPGDAKEIAEVGSGLVRKSLQALTGVDAGL